MTETLPAKKVHDGEVAARGEYVELHAPSRTYPILEYGGILMDKLVLNIERGERLAIRLPDPTKPKEVAAAKGDPEGKFVYHPTNWFMFMKALEGAIRAADRMANTAYEADRISRYTRELCDLVNINLRNDFPEAFTALKPELDRINKTYGFAPRDR